MVLEIVQRKGLRKGLQDQLLEDCYQEFAPMGLARKTTGVAGLALAADPREWS
jgi:hypothetical protein